jgi:hypothetical protein
MLIANFDIAQTLGVPPVGGLDKLLGNRNLFLTGLGAGLIPPP